MSTQLDFLSSLSEYAAMVRIVCKHVAGAGQNSLEEFWLEDPAPVTNLTVALERPPSVVRSLVKDPTFCFCVLAVIRDQTHLGNISDEEFQTLVGSYKKEAGEVNLVPIGGDVNQNRDLNTSQSSDDSPVLVVRGPKEKFLAKILQRNKAKEDSIIAVKTEPMADQAEMVQDLNQKFEVPKPAVEDAPVDLRLQSDQPEEMVAAPAVEVKKCPLPNTKCHSCRKFFEDSALHHEHVTNNTCTLCGKVLLCESRRRQHVTKMHRDVGSRVEPKRMRFSTKKLVLTSDESSSEEDDFEEQPEDQLANTSFGSQCTCRHCGEDFEDKDTLHLHKVNRTCDICLGIFKCNTDRLQHEKHCGTRKRAKLSKTPSPQQDRKETQTPPEEKKENEIQIGQCPLCSKALQLGPEMQTHCAFRMCNTCQATFKCRTQFSSHLFRSIACSSAESQLLKCTYCAGAVDTDQEMKSHLEHRSCECGQKFSCVSLLDTHRSLNTCRKKQLQLDEKCNLCSKPIKKPDIHLKRRCCKFCGAFYSCVNLWREHRHTCFANKDLVCPHCLKKFCSVKFLQRHLTLCKNIKRAEETVLTEKQPEENQMVVTEKLSAGQPDVVIIDCEKEVDMTEMDADDAAAGADKSWSYEDEFDMVPLDPFEDAVV